MEKNRSTKYIRIHTAQAGGGAAGAPLVDLWQAGAEAVKGIGDVAKKYESDNKGESSLTKDEQPADEIALANKKARGLFESKGLGSRYDEFSRKLGALEGDEKHQKIVLQSIIPQFLTAVSKASSESMAPIDAIFDLAAKIYYEAPRLDLVEQTLSTISRYEKMMPGISFWEDALKASKGEDYEQLFNMKKMAIMGIGKAENFGDFEDLDTVVGFANAPGSKFDQSMMQRMRSDVARQRATEESGLMTVQLRSLYKKQHNDAVQKINEFYQRNFRKITDNKLFDFWMRVLYGISALSTGKNLFSNLVAPAESQGVLTGTAASARGAARSGGFTRVAQSPQDIRPGGSVGSGASASGGAASTPAAGAGASGAAANTPENILTKIASWEKLTKAKSDFKIQKDQFEILMETIRNAQSQTVSSLAGEALGGGASAPMADAQQIIGLSLQAKEMVGQLFGKASEIIQVVNEVEADPSILLEASKNKYVASRVKSAIATDRSVFMRVQEELRGHLITLEENINMGPLFVEINALSFVEREYEAAYNQASTISPIGAMPAAQGYGAVLMKLYSLYQQVAAKYVELASSAPMQQMKQVYALRARSAMMTAMEKGAKAYSVANQASGGIFGKSAGVAPYLFKKTAEDVQEDLEREADARIRRYFDNLFKDTPGSPDVGTVLDNPAPYRGVLTTDVGKSKKYRRHRSRLDHTA